MRHTILASRPSSWQPGSRRGCKSRDGTSAIAPKTGRNCGGAARQGQAGNKGGGAIDAGIRLCGEGRICQQDAKGNWSTFRESWNRLGAKVDRASGAAKVDAKVKASYGAREKWTQTKQQLDRAETATASNWDESEEWIKQSYADLKNSFEKTRQWLSDKIAPDAVVSRKRR